MRLRPRCVLVVAFAIGSFASALAQEAKPLAFDVASVRLSAKGTPQARRFSPGRVELVNISLDEVVQTAFGIERRNRLSVPGWLADVRVEIRAVSSLTAPAQVREMLRTLLVERFGLVTHMEPRPFDVHELLVGSGGHTMREVEAVNDLVREFSGAPGAGVRTDTIAETIEGPRRIMMSARGQRIVTDRTMYELTYPETGAVRIVATRMSMAELASMLTFSVGAEQVFDRTGLTGLYQFTIDLPNNPLPIVIRRADGTLPEPSRFSAAKAVEGLGLRLERQRAPLDVVVVDTIAREPTEN